MRQAAIDEAIELLHGDRGQKRVPVALVRAEAAFLAGDPQRALQETGAIPVVASSSTAGSPASWRSGESGRAGHPRTSGTCPSNSRSSSPVTMQARRRSGRSSAVRTTRLMALAWSDDEAELRRSHEQLLALGAQPAAAFVARRLRERGARGVARGPRAATREHPAGLTRRELDVLELLAEGLTNAEIATRLVITEKTVGHHVSSILGKPAVRSRYDAAKLASKIGSSSAQDRERGRFARAQTLLPSLDND